MARKILVIEFSREELVALVRRHAAEGIDLGGEFEADDIEVSFEGLDDDNFPDGSCSAKITAK